MIRLKRTWIAPGVVIPLALAALAVLAMPGEEWPGLNALPLSTPSPAESVSPDFATDDLPLEARAKAAQRRGGDWKRQPLEGLELSLETPAEQLLALDEALASIEAADPRRGEIVRLRFFAGLSEDETAEMLQISKRTVSREWGLARADLALSMSPPDA